MTEGESTAQLTMRLRLASGAVVVLGAALVALIDPDWIGYAVLGLGVLDLLLSPLVANLIAGQRR